MTYRATLGLYKFKSYHPSFFQYVLPQTWNDHQQRHMYSNQSITIQKIKVKPCLWPQSKKKKMEKLSAKLVSSVTLEKEQTTCILPHSLTPFFPFSSFRDNSSINPTINPLHPFCLSSLSYVQSKTKYGKQTKNE